jgi:putative membrane protein insertion efficiency factor
MAAGRRVAQLAIRGYQVTLSGVIGRTCRHLPSCSDYTAEAIGRHGAWAGSWMGLARIARCGPGGTSGLDFVCEDVPSSATWARPWRYGLWRGTNPPPPGRLQVDVASTSTSTSSPVSTRNSRV